MDRNLNATAHEKMPTILIFVLAQITRKLAGILNVLRLLEIGIGRTKAKTR